MTENLFSFIPLILGGEYITLFVFTNLLNVITI